MAKLYLYTLRKNLSWTGITPFCSDHYLVWFSLVPSSAPLSCLLMASWSASCQLEFLTILMCYVHVYYLFHPLFSLALKSLIGRVNFSTFLIIYFNCERWSWCLSSRWNMWPAGLSMSRFSQGFCGLSLNKCTVLFRGSLHPIISSLNYPVVFQYGGASSQFLVGQFPLSELLWIPRCIMLQAYCYSCRHQFLRSSSGNESDLWMVQIIFTWMRIMTTFEREVDITVHVGLLNFCRFNMITLLDHPHITHVHGCKLETMMPKSW